MAPLEVWYLLENDMRFVLMAPGEICTVHDLKKKIYPDATTAMLNNLAVFRLKTPLPLEEELNLDDEEWLSQIKNAPTDKLFPRSKIKAGAEWPPANCLHFLLEICKPPALDVAYGAARNESLNDEPFDMGAAVKKFEDVFIKVQRWGQFVDSDLEENCIETSVEFHQPGFLRKFLIMLDDKPVSADDVQAEQIIGDKKCRDAYLFDIETPNVEGTTPGHTVAEGHDEDNLKRIAEREELLHVGHVACPIWQALWSSSGGALKEGLANSMFFHKLQVYIIQKDYQIVAQTGFTPWPFMFVLSCQAPEVAGGKKEYRTYAPKSDFLVSRSRLPRLLVEIQSQMSGGSSGSSSDFPEDMVRMLLQGASVVRTANGFLDAFKDKNFVLIAFYIFADGKVSRFILYQSGTHPKRKVYCLRKSSHLNSSVARVEFASQLYNLIHTLENEVFDKGMDKEMERLGDVVLDAKRKHKWTSFHTKPRTKRKRPDGGDDNRDSNPNSSVAGASTGGTDGAELREKGYEAIPDFTLDDNGNIETEAIFKHPPHILTVCRLPGAGRPLIAKKVRKESREIDILRSLGSSDHIIQILDSFNTPSASWLIMPKMSSVAYCLWMERSEIADKVDQVCSGLIHGLAYLHGRRVAHRDVNPSNIVVDICFCTKLIDFDVAIQLRHEDDEVDDLCGTEHWVAPEIEKEVSTYSPIKADRWACGHVILSIFDELGRGNKDLRCFAMKLKADDPQQRPQLIDWCESQEPSSVATPRARQRSIGVGEESNAKRQRRAVFEPAGEALVHAQVEVR